MVRPPAYKKKPAKAPSQPGHLMIGTDIERLTNVVHLFQQGPAWNVGDSPRSRRWPVEDGRTNEGDNASNGSEDEDLDSY